MGRPRTPLTISLLVVMWAGLLGCTTGAYGRYYHPATLETFPPTKVIEVYDYTHRGYERYRKQRYILVGESHFTGPTEKRAAAVRQAQKVGADVVLLASTYVDTQQSAIPVQRYHPPGSYSVDTTYGGGRAHSTITPQPHGYTTTSWIPISIHRYDQEAIFLRRPRSPDN